MKTSLWLFIGLCLALPGCSPDENIPVDPQQNQPKSTTTARVGFIAKPDLIIYKLTYNGSSGTYPDGAGGRVFVITIMEKNIGIVKSTASATDYDQIKVYQLFRGAKDTYRYIKTFRRTTNLAPNAIWTKPASAGSSSDYIWIPGEYMPTNRVVELVFQVDGGSTIDELNETNNFSSPFRVTY